MTLAAGIASLIGPTTAAVFQTPHLELLPDPLMEVWLVAIIGVFGVVVGILSIWRGTIIAGIVCVLANGAVAGLYGLIAVFSVWAFQGSTRRWKCANVIGLESQFRHWLRS
jgi:hypothetical protein